MTEQIAKLLVVSMNTDMEPRRVELDLTPEECMVPAKMRGAVARHLHLPESELGEVHMVRRTLDCRRRNVIYHATVEIGSHNEIDDDANVLSLPLTPFHSPQKQSSLSVPVLRVSSQHCAACSWA